MTTFDATEVQKFTASLASRMDSCDNCEGMYCSNLDNSLRLYAKLCCEFREEIRSWGRAVFTGQVAFDAAVEDIWLREGSRLRSRATEMLGYGQKSQNGCYALEGQPALQSALWDLSQLLDGWVTPTLAAGPSARQRLDPILDEEISRKIASLPPVPADWQPSDPRQKQVYRMLGG